MAVANGVVYVGATDGSHGIVYALNASTGQYLWKYTTGEEVIYSTTAVANGVVYFGSADFNPVGGELYALNASTGALLWKYNLQGPVEASPAVANGVVYIGTGDGYLYAFNASTGAVLLLKSPRHRVDSALLPRRWSTVWSTSDHSTAIFTLSICRAVEPGKSGNQCHLPLTRSFE